MNKAEFLAQLEEALSGLPEEDARERLAFYAEMIDDRVEEGLSEEEAVEKIGPVGGIVEQALVDIPLGKLVRESVTSRRKMRAWEKLLLVLGFPLWFPLLAAAAAVALSLYAVLWALVICLWAVEAALGASALAGIAAAVMNALHGQILPAAALLGTGLVCAGLSVFLFPACRSAAKQMLRLSAKAALWVKSRLI